MERDAPAAIASLRAGLDLGCTHIDTAELYGNGQVEEIVGQAIAGRRDEVFLVSKVLPTNASRRGTIAACERSLQRLATDRLDCFLLHWPGPHPLADTIAAFEELAQAGKIAAWGVSNFDEAELAAALALAPGKVACNQVLYHLGERAIEHAVVPFCARHSVAVVAYSPFGSGPLPGAGTAGGDALRRVAARHDVEAHAVALAFVLRLPGVLAIPKSVRVEHVRANAQALAVRLAADDLDELEQAFPRGRRPERLPTI